MLTRFWWGFTRPFTLIRSLWSEPVARRAWLLTIGLQAVVVLGIGSVKFISDLEPLDSRQERAERTRIRTKLRADRARARAERAAEKDARDLPAHAEPRAPEVPASETVGSESAPEPPSPGAGESAPEPPFPPGEAPGAATGASEPAGSTTGSAEPESADGTGADLEAALTQIADELAAEAQSVDVTAADADPSAATASAAARLEPEPPPEAGADDDEERRPEWLRSLALWASSLVLVQAVVLALTRDFQDRLARDLALVAGLQPEDVPRRMRVRLDLKWLLRKLRRRMRGVFSVAQGVTALTPIIMTGSALGLDGVTSVVTFVVSAYWWVVFTAARSARAFRGEEDPRPGTPVRLATAFYSRFPGLGWYVRLSNRATRDLAAPSRAVERDFAAFAGLGLARVIATLPVFRLALRTAIVVASAELLEQLEPEVVLQKSPSALPEPVSQPVPPVPTEQPGPRVGATA